MEQPPGTTGTNADVDWMTAEVVADAALTGSLWRRGRRAALAGGGIALGVVLLVVLAVVVLLRVMPGLDDGDTSSAETTTLLLQGITFVLFGIAAGLFIAVTPVTKRLKTVGGARPAARQLRDIVFRDATPSSAAQQVQAGRYALLAATVLPYSALCLAMLFLASVLQQSTQLLQGSSSTSLGFLVFNSVLIIAFVVLSAVFIPLNLRRGHQAASYSRSHPINGIAAETGEAPSAVAGHR